MLTLPSTDLPLEFPTAVRGRAQLVTGMTATATCAILIPHQCRRQSPLASQLVSHLVSRRASRRASQQVSQRVSQRVSQQMCQLVSRCASQRVSRRASQRVSRRASLLDSLQVSPREGQLQDLQVYPQESRLGSRLDCRRGILHQHSRRLVLRYTPVHPRSVLVMNGTCWRQ